MPMNRIFVAIALALLTLPLIHAEDGVPADVHISFDEKGLHSLTCNGTEFLESGELRVEQAALSDEKRESSNVEIKAPKVVVNRDVGTVTQTWDWGRIETSFASSANKVDIAVRIS